MKENFSVKDENGSITMFVLIGLLFMVGILIISYGIVVNNSKIVKEQANIISQIYMPNNDINESYNEIYANLRKKNKKTITETNKDNADTSTIVLSNTYAGEITNYKIYGSFEGVGDLITDDKYAIQLKITASDGDNANSKTYKIVLNSPLYENEYIDYSEKKVTRSNNTKEDIDLPELYTYEDYTKIEILTENAPEEMTIKYTGYTLE